MKEMNLRKVNQNLEHLKQLPLLPILGIPSYLKWDSNALCYRNCRTHFKLIFGI